MDGSINFSGTLAGSIANDGGGGDVTDVKVRDSQETTFESVVNEQGVAEIDLISYVRRNELTQAIENVENSIDNVEQLVDTKQNIINYSTEEQIIGTYFGKPLYQKCISVPNFSFNTPLSGYIYGQITVSEYITNCEYLWVDMAKSHFIIDNKERNFVFYEAGLDDDALVLFNYTKRINVELCLTLQYTKTTD